MDTGRPPHIVIVGGGIAGLAAAHRLQELSHERELPLRFTLLEARGRVGGTLGTEHRDGFLLELGPDSFISEKPWALALCRRIGLEPELIATRDEYRTTFVVHHGMLEPLPEGFMLLAPTKLGPLLRSRLFSWPGKLRMALDLVLPRGPQRDDESLGSFVRRRFGREVLERVAQPLIGGIYTADPDALSLASTMPRFLQMEREQRSVITAMWKASRSRPQEGKSASGARWSLFVSLRNGMQTLVDALTARLALGHIRLHCAVSQLQWLEGQWYVECEDDTVLSADGVILTTPTFQAAPLLRRLDPQLADHLATIRYSSAATVNLAFRRDQIAHPLNGFGFVVPHIENRKLIACSFSSVKYAGRAPEGYALLRAFVGGSLQEEVFNFDDTAMTEVVRHELATFLGVHTAPLFVHIARYPHSMPQYQIGHLRVVEKMDSLVAQHPGLALAGNAYRGVGIADCVRSGEAAAELVLTQVSPNPP